MIISKVISTVIKNSRLIVKSLVYGKKDVRNAYSVNPFGIDSNIPSGYRGIYSNTGNEEEKILIGVISDKVLTDVGELRLYSEDSGTKQAEVWLKNDGDIELNGNSDNAVRYSELKTAFDELKNDFNSLVSSYNSHIHVTTATIGATATPGVISPTVSSGSPSTADVSGAKIDNIKTN